MLFVVFLNQQAKQGPVLFHSISACWHPPIHLPGITRRKRSSKADSEREDVTRNAHNSPMNLGEFAYSMRSSMEQLLFLWSKSGEALYREKIFLIQKVITIWRFSWNWGFSNPKFDSTLCRTNQPTPNTSQVQAQTKTERYRRISVQWFKQLLFSSLSKSWCLGMCACTSAVPHLESQLILQITAALCSGARLRSSSWGPNTSCYPEHQETWFLVETSPAKSASNVCLVNTESFLRKYLCKPQEAVWELQRMWRSKDSFKGVCGR